MWLKTVLFILGNEVQVPCNNTGLCIYEEWICDGIDDCGDNSDEANCNGKN